MHQKHKMFFRYFVLFYVQKHKTKSPCASCVSSLFVKIIFTNEGDEETNAVHIRWMGALIVATTLGLISCSKGRARPRSEARILEVVAAVETEPVNTGGDSADDATVWVNPSDPAQSLVIGTNKKRCLVLTSSAATFSSRRVSALIL